MGSFQVILSGILLIGGFLAFWRLRIMTLECYFWYFLEFAASYHNSDFLSRKNTHKKQAPGGYERVF